MLSRVAGPAFAVLFLAVQSPVKAAESCKAPLPVCDARAAVFGVSSFDPVGSAVRIGPGLLVTNRHIVADKTEVEIILPDGTRIQGKVEPTSFLGDLILVRAELPDGPSLELSGETSDGLWSVGQDISERRIKVYAKGRMLLAPAPAKPYARLHHTAYSQPGNSGGAVVDKDGRLVAIAASGGEGRFEAVPAAQIAALRDQSGPEHADKSKLIGKNLRECTLMLEKAQRMGNKLPDKVADIVKNSCAASENRQLYDLAGQLLARQRWLDDAVEFFERSIEKDPNAINSRLGLVIALRFARRLDDAKPHVRWLLDVIPEERMIHPVALHVGKVTNDQKMVAEALGLIEKHAPNQLEAAKNFLKSPVR
ncbi:MAG: serine protease [Hyphomicrobiaceae bacterium]|nr:serine protease [Hyphomicrobiaceae bacterium]